MLTVKLVKFRLHDWLNCRRNVVVLCGLVRWCVIQNLNPVICTTVNMFDS